MAALGSRSTVEKMRAAWKRPRSVTSQQCGIRDSGRGEQPGWLGDVLDRPGGIASARTDMSVSLSNLNMSFHE